MSCARLEEGRPKSHIVGNATYNDQLISEAIVGSNGDECEAARGKAKSLSM